MKKLVLTLAVLVVTGGAVSAVDLLKYPPPVEGGDFMLNVGGGFSLPYERFYGFDMMILPVFATGEYALPVKLPISVGGIIGIWQYGWDGNVYTYVPLAARANWHWAFNVNWLDFYTGISAGYLYSTTGYMPFIICAQIGAHFYFKKNIGIGVEVDAGSLMLTNASVAFKF
jgi:hypothetical protein